MRPTGTGVARSALALLLVAQTGCYHFSTHSFRQPVDRPERTVRQADGTEVSLAVQEPEPGAVVLVATEQAVCREVERGTRTFQVRTITTKGSPISWGSIGGGGDPLTLAIACVILPVGLLVWIIQTAAPDRSESVEATDDPPRAYLEWRGPRVGCDGAAWTVGDLSLRLEARAPEAACLAWTARTRDGGRLLLGPLLDRATAVTGPCRGWPGAGELLVTVDAEAVEGEPAPQALPVDHRTFETVTVRLTGAQIAALGLEAPPRPTGPKPPPWQGRRIDGARVLQAVRDCAPRLDPACRAALEGCLREAGERGDPEAARRTCAYLAPRCEPATDSFEWCLKTALE